MFRRPRDHDEREESEDQLERIERKVNYLMTLADDLATAQAAEATDVQAALDRVNATIAANSASIADLQAQLAAALAAGTPVTQAMVDAANALDTSIQGIDATPAPAPAP